MKKVIEIFINALLIMILATNLLPPLHVKANPGTIVTITGQVKFQPRNYSTTGVLIAGKELEVDLFEKDHNNVVHDLNKTTYTSTTSGVYSFMNVTNYFDANNPHLNIFIRVKLNYSGSVVAPVGSTTPYYFESDTELLNNDNQITWILNFDISNQNNPTNYQAVPIFEDIRNAWHFVNTNDVRNGVHFDPGSVTANWTPGTTCDGPCASYTTPYYIFISDNDIRSMDVVVHETGHKFMGNGIAGWWYPWPDCWGHHMFDAIDNQCAWAEGWADFFAIAVNGDQCYNFFENPCAGTPDGDYYNLEVHNRLDDPSQFPMGDTVEARVAATLYDLYDNSNEGYDEISAGFAPISQLALGNIVYHPLLDFWYAWNQSSGQDTHKSGMTFWWNSINYANIPQYYMPLIMK